MNSACGALWGAWLLFWLATGLLLAIFGTCLAGGRVWNLSVVVMAAVLLIVKLKAEEALLTRQFPDAYPLYQRRVKAIIPFLS